jgi:predicted RNA-binding Zn-ribbon protein involved in translation (DUF1610 family)
MPTTNKEREIRIAQKRVEGFAQQFGEAHRNLARHAAFPLVLTPDLLYQIWANFVPEAPWTAVAHVLLSRLCRHVSYEMYEMDIADRNFLLRELKVEFGQERFDEVGEFLLDYVAQRLTDDDAARDLREAQEWTALAYTKPNEAARELAQRLSERVTGDDVGEMLWLASLVESLAEPIVEAGFEPLLVYSLATKSFIFGKLEDAIEQFEEILDEENQLWVAGVSLPVPEEIISAILETKEPKVLYLQASEEGLIRIEQAIEGRRWEKVDKRWIKAAKTSVENLENFWNRLKIPEDDFIRICQAVDVDWRDIRQGSHFSTLRSKMTDAEIIKATLRDLGITVKTDADVRGYNGMRVRTDIVAVLEGECDIGWTRNSDGSFDMICDLWCVAKKHNQTILINSISQKYAVNKTLADVKQRGVLKKMKCPKCTSTQIGKYGYFQGKQNYKCRNCGTQFTDF